MNKAGSALIETLVLLMVCISIWIAGLSTVSLSFAKLWLEHALYTRLLCELKSSAECENDFMKKIEILTWGSVAQKKIETHSDSEFYKTVDGELEWQSAQSKIIKVKMTLRERDLRDLPY